MQIYEVNDLEKLLEQFFTYYSLYSFLGTDTRGG
jgi:hypothetical protein